VVVALAGRQHGVVARRQLLAEGVGAKAIRERTASGLLVTVHRGVYALGGRPRSRSAHFMAAVLAAGDAAAISHVSAAHLHGLLPGETARTHVTTPARAGPRPGLIVHHAEPWADGERTAVDAIPCTSVAGTLADLATTEPARRIERAIEEAERRGLFDLDVVEAVMARRRAGRQGLQEALDRFTGTTMTRSDLEEAFLALVRSAGLRQPELNVPIALGDGRFVEIDALWREARLAVELDSERHHRGRIAFHGDRAKGAELLATLDLRPLRFSDMQIEQRPEWVLTMLRRALG
jgi:predicted transcriptional regulator of viral defense system